MITVDAAEFRLWAGYLQDISGLFLDESKAYLLETRLSRMLKELQCGSFQELYWKVRNDRSRSIEKRVIDLMTTNETSFFRNEAPFEMLKYKIIPDLIDRKVMHSRTSGPISIRIWSAACSTGQEVYSIAMSLQDILDESINCNISIVGTDISGAAIARASSGIYNRFEMERGLSPAQVKHYFLPQGETWKVRDELRAMVAFKKHNLQHSFADLGRFDIVFCRNVAIYFAARDRKTLFQKMARAMDRNGYLIVGASESLSQICPWFEPRRYLRSVFYQLNGQWPECS